MIGGLRYKMQKRTGIQHYVKNLNQYYTLLHNQRHLQLQLIILPVDNAINRSNKISTKHEKYHSC